MLDNLVTDLSIIHEDHKDLKSKNPTPSKHVTPIESNVHSKRNSRNDIRTKPAFDELNTKLLAL